MAAWIEIRLEVAREDGEVAADILQQFCRGGSVIEERASVQQTEEWATLPSSDPLSPIVVKGYIPTEEASNERLKSLRLAMSMAPFAQPPRWKRRRRLREVDWRDGWKRYFKPLAVGRHLVIKPSWHDYSPREGQIVIEIDPGMAFGTGQHPTTEMCLETLEEEIRPGDRVLDIGTGSGILAIAAAKLGARAVRAIDNDADAVKAARSNAAANGVGDRVEVLEGKLEQQSHSERYDLLLMNISGALLERLASKLAEILREGGRVIASGFLAEGLESALSALEQAGLKVKRVLSKGEWRAVIAERPGAKVLR